MIQPQFFEERGRIRNFRSARTATKTRFVRNARARYVGILRVCFVLGALLVLLLGYVMLTSNMTSLTYSVAKAHHNRETLQEQGSRLEDRIAALRSADRLASIASKLGMRESQQFALVALSAPPIAHSRSFPVLSSIAGWFGAGVPRTLER
ncbi:MAG: hypothetical protein M3R51_09990 [Candidatus Eremiobacteraeota bacterium]|nr:hypothetical protein [Candidatus Eremiobacteraeota bacterium]